MSQEDPRLDENGTPTLDQERESEDTADLEALFAEADDRDEDEPVTREEIERWRKGTQKLASELGRLRAEKSAVKTEGAKVQESTSGINPVVKNLYFNANPEAREIWEDVEKEAKNLGKDPFDLYENSSYFKGEAKARFAEKSEREENKGKLTKPSGGAYGSTSRIPFESIDLENPEHAKYLRNNPKIRAEYSKWWSRR
jgi:hypothetical protein